MISCTRLAKLARFDFPLLAVKTCLLSSEQQKKGDKNAPRANRARAGHRTVSAAPRHIVRVTVKDESKSGRRDIFRLGRRIKKLSEPP